MKIVESSPGVLTVIRDAELCERTMSIRVQVQQLDCHEWRPAFLNALRRFIAMSEADDEMEQSGMAGYGEPIEIHWDVTDSEPVG